MVWIALATVVAAVCWWFGTGLQPIWWLTWLASVPILWLATKVSSRATYLLAFAALLAGACNSYVYLRSLIGLGLPLIALAFAGPALLFAWSFVLWRRLMLAERPWAAALAFASFSVVFQFATRQFSANATWGDLAYSQMDCLPVLQLASLTGLSGIDFLLMFVPAALTAVLVKRGKQQARCAICALATLALAVAWGTVRLRSAPANGTSIKVALIATDEEEYTFPKQGPVEQRLFAEYARVAQQELRNGAQLVLLPEKLARVSVGERSQLATEAKEFDAAIAFGLETADQGRRWNEEIVHSPQGEFVYRKEHMVPGFESHLTVGTELVTLNAPSGKWGFEVCKDMDFPGLSRKYGQQGVGLMVVPAWDFVLDDWLHSRMAIARGVEGGFTVVRAAKQGLLTISDSRGAVLAQRSSRAAGFSRLLAMAPVMHVDTLYTQWGDWFAWLNVLIFPAALFLRKL